MCSSDLVLFGALRAGGGAVLLADPLAARNLVEREGFTEKKALIEWIAANARIPARRWWGQSLQNIFYGNRARDGVEPWATYLKADPDELIPVNEPEDVHVVVAGAGPWRCGACSRGGRTAASGARCPAAPSRSTPGDDPGSRRPARKVRTRKMRHNRRTRLGLRFGATAGALVLAATACGDGGGSSDGTVTLRMYSTTTTEPAFRALIDGFHKSQSKIKVKAEFIPSAKVGQVTTTMMQAGNPPDVIPASPGSGGGSNGLSVYRLAEANRLADLSGRPWANDLPALLKPPAQYEGKTYSLILGVSTQFLNYTVTDLEKWNVEPPKTFKGLLDMCAFIKSKGKYMMASGAADMAGNRMRMQVFADE